MFQEENHLQILHILHLIDVLILLGNPDCFYGARPEQLNRRIRNELNGLIVSSIQEDLLVVPDFFIAVKLPSNWMVKTRASYCYHMLYTDSTSTG